MTSPRRSPPAMSELATSLVDHEPDVVITRPGVVYSSCERRSLSADRRRSSSVASARLREPAPRNMVPKLKDPNMWIRPSLDALSLMSEAELARVDNLAIGHYSYGKITWPGLTDVRYLSVDDTVQFVLGKVAVFLDDSVRPPVGKGLNKPAVVELYVKPKNMKRARQQPEKYINRMRQLTEDLDATFLSYDLETWRFKVDNFARGPEDGPPR
ncbi:hypothetical protein FOZ63_004725 [Perkinsus olseni]|nr:hypothetical protein FOZ63_004725 [Perkinsus olseni]